MNFNEKLSLASRAKVSKGGNVVLPFISQVKYHLQFLPVSVMGMEPLKAIEQLERSLLEKKSEMTQFQTEFLEVKKR